MTNNKLQSWIDEMAALCKPDHIHFCDGSEKEYNDLMNQMVLEKKAVKLKQS